MRHKLIKIAARLWRGYETARLVELRVKIPPEACMSVCLSEMSVVCSQVEVFATGWSLIERSPIVNVSLNVIVKPR